MNPFSLYHSTMEETRHITHQRKGLIRVTDFIKVQDCTCWSHYKQWNHTLTSFSSQASFSYSKKNIGIAQESLLKLKLSDSAPQFPCCHNGANTICPWLGTCWESSCKRAHLCGQSIKWGLLYAKSSSVCMTEDKAQETGGLVGKSPNLIFKSWGKSGGLVSQRWEET